MFKFIVVDGIRLTNGANLNDKMLAKSLSKLSSVAIEFRQVLKIFFYSLTLAIFLNLILNIAAIAQSVNFTGTAIGVGAIGSYSYQAPTYSITATGSGVGSTSDSTYFINTPVSGSNEITANFSTLTSGSNPNSQAGLMLRQNQNNASDVNAFLYVTPNNGINFSYRQNASGQTTTILGPSIVPSTTSPKSDLSQSAILGVT